MKIIVVGGHTRNIGKTSLAVNLIRAFPELEWTAVKITQYGHGVCSHNGKPCGCAPAGHPMALSEESCTNGGTDTSRFLAAGAQRALWLRVRHGQLGQALSRLQRALHGAKYAMVESNSLLEFIKPDLYLMALDSARVDFKESARRFLKCADAFVSVSSLPVSNLWPGVDAEIFHQKPHFRLEPEIPITSTFRRFVESKLGLL